MSDIVSIISNIGFPIFACVVMGYYIYVMSKAHKSEIDEMRQAICNNTQAINELIKQLGKENNENAED